MPMVFTGGTCCAPSKVTGNDTGADCDDPVKAAMPAKHPATMTFQRDIERFIRFLPSSILCKSFDDPGQRAGEEDGGGYRGRYGDTEQQSRSKGTATKTPAIGSRYYRRRRAHNGGRHQLEALAQGRGREFH